MGPGLPVGGARLCRRVFSGAAAIALCAGLSSAGPSAAGSAAGPGCSAGTGTGDGAGSASHPVGFSPGFAIIDDRPLPLGRDLDGMRDIGAGWVRIDVSWSRAEPTPGRFDWADTDRVIAAAEARGLSVLAVIGYEPTWARSYRPDGRRRPPDPAGFGRFATAAAGRYASAVSAWEVWNEPNLRRFWGTDPSPDAYARLLRAAAAASRAEESSGPVVTGGLAPAVDADDGSQLAPETFLKRLYGNGVRSSLDAVAVHPYSYPAMPTGSQPWNTFGRLRALHAIMQRRGDGAKQLWLTEYGAPTGTSGRAVPPRRQAAMLVEAYDEAAALDFAGPLFFYSYRDGGTDASKVEHNFGVVRRDRTPKPAATALRRTLS